MKEIRYRGVLYAIQDGEESLTQLDMGRLEEGSTWYGDNDQGLQASRMVYGRKTFDNHRHKTNPRVIEYTQEALICIKGRIEVKVYDNKKRYLDTVILKGGDIGIFYDGYHELSVKVDNTIAYEIKSGQFTSIQKDKEYYE